MPQALVNFWSDLYSFMTWAWRDWHEARGMGLPHERRKLKKIRYLGK